MKTNLFFAIAAMFLLACSTMKENVKTSANLTSSSHDSTEYDIIIIDSGFDPWYRINYSEAKDHSTEYYRSKNLIAVALWNDWYRNGKFRIIDSAIDYQPDIDYGKEVNRKLYWYFIYVNDHYKIPLIK